MSLARLPNELVNRTCSYLEQPEWAALRLSCRSLYTASFDAFADRYFKSICFIATSEGIRELEELARSVRVRPRVCQLWMIPTVFEGRHNRSFVDFERSQYSRRLGQLEQNGDTLLACYKIYQAIEADNLALLESDTFSSRLHTCFASFRNLKSVGLKHYATDFLLDPRQTQFRYLGLHKLRDQIAYRYHHSGINSLQWHQVAKVNSLALSRVLEGLNRSNRNIKALNTCGANICGSTSPDLPLTQEQYDSLLPKLQDLEYLHMCICYNKEEADCTPRTYIDLLIHVAPRINTLVFSQWYQNPRNMTESSFSELSQNIKFTRLKELHLHWIQIRVESLKSFLDTAKETLCSLTLELVTLKTDTPPKINPEPTSWKDIWEFLGRDLSLQNFYMGNLGYWGRKVMIQGPDDLLEPTYTACYDAKVTTAVFFDDWIRQFKPILSKIPDLTVRKYSDFLHEKNSRSTDAPASGHQIHERRSQTQGLGSQRAANRVRLLRAIRRYV